MNLDDCDEIEKKKKLPNASFLFLLRLVWTELGSMRIANDEKNRNSPDVIPFIFTNVSAEYFNKFA